MAASAPPSTASHHGLEQIGTGERAGGVVHDDDVGALGHRGRDRHRTDAERVAPPATTAVTAGLGVVDSLGRNHEHDTVGRSRGRRWPRR